jgi:uncharacterized protein YybS (DUF2232 family)
MVQPDSRQQDLYSVQTLLIALVFFLPLALPVLFVWMNLFLAVPILYLLQTSTDEHRTLLQVRNGLVFAALGAFFLGQMGPFLFSLAMLPLAYSLHRSLQQGIAPAQAGGAALMILGLTWLGYWFVYGLLADVNPYTSLLQVLDRSLEQTVEIYRSNVELSADVLYNLEWVIAGMRNIILPKILPGLLAASVLLTVWLNMVAGNYLLRRLRPDQNAWPAFRYWQVPYYLIWLLIAAGIVALMGTGTLKNIGYSLVLVLALVYFFQGLAIFNSLLYHWNLPLPMKIFLYLVVVVQSYGMILLTIAGIADTWADFRRLAKEADPS